MEVEHKVQEVCLHCSIPTKPYTLGPWGTLHSRTICASETQSIPTIYCTLLQHFSYTIGFWHLDPLSCVFVSLTGTWRQNIWIVAPKAFPGTCMSSFGPMEYPIISGLVCLGHTAHAHWSSALIAPGGGSPEIMSSLSTIWHITAPELMTSLTIIRTFSVHAKQKRLPAP